MKLKQFIITALLVISTSAFAGNFHSLIVGGTDAIPGEFPFMVSFQSGSFGGHFCGGSLIKKNWVLTAGHCASYVASAKAVIGLHKQSDTSNAEIFKVKRVIRHPGFSNSTLEHDFALVELDGESSYAPIALNDTEIDIPKTTDNQIDSITAGWGTMKEGGGIAQTLQKVHVPLVNADICNQSYNGEIADSMICAGLPAGGKDACQGDSGGPLFVTENGHYKLVGVVSWGQGCARPNYYGVYSKVNSAIDWINQNAL